MTGAPMIVLPGLTGDGRMFAPMLAGLAEGAALDGYYGHADRIDAMARWAIARIPDGAIVFGHSMGGRVALEVIRQAPGRVAGLVLADTGIHPVKPGERDSRYALRDVGRAQGFAALVDQWLPPMVAPHHRTPAVMEPLSAMVRDAGQAVFEAQTEALLHRPATDAALAAIAVPTLVMTGSLDTWSPPAQHAEIAAHIPGAELAIVPDAGHMAPFEAAGAVAALVTNWMARAAA